MRVQFTISEQEWQLLEKEALEAGYPDVSSFCKDSVLKQKTYLELWNIVTKKISSKASGDIFALRDLIKNPPANLGVKLYQHQNKLGIEVVKKDSLNTNVFRKK